MSVFKGAGVAIVTPMYEDETVNYDKLGEILDEQVARKGREGEGGPRRALHSHRRV